MNATLLIATWLVPLMLAPLATRAGRAPLSVIAALPALATLLFVPTGVTVEVDWLLLGLHFGLDESSRLLLLGATLTWLSAALFSMASHAGDTQAGRFRLFFLLAMGGNLLLLVAQDAMAFYLGYALMGISAYGLVAHRRTRAARRAARVYLGWTLVGELLLFCALVLLAGASSERAVTFDALRATPYADAMLAMLLLAFGIKVAVIGLHAWMPLAYAAAPAAGSAVLAGAMINAGVLGWLRLLPLGETGFAAWGTLLIGLGLLATFYAVAIGLVQRHPKVVLAYSSMSQMGIVTAAVGVMLAAPQTAALLTVALCIYAVHHGLAKGALFLLSDRQYAGAGTRAQFALLVLLCLVLAGAPLTSGAVAKGLLKDALPAAWEWLPLVLTASTLATTLLMSRFLAVSARMTTRAHPFGLPAIAAIALPVVAGAAIAWLHPHAASARIDTSGLLPVSLGIALAWLTWRAGWPWPLPRIAALPPGDVPVLLVRGAGRLRAAMPGKLHTPSWETINPLPSLAEAGEARLRAWPTAGLAWLLVCLALLAGVATW